MLLHKEAIPTYIREADYFIALCTRINASVCEKHAQEIHQEKEELQRLDQEFGRISQELHETHLEFIKEDNLVDQIVQHAKIVSEKIPIPSDMQELRTVDRILLSDTRAAVESARLVQASIELLQQHIPESPSALSEESIQVIDEETRKGAYHMQDFKTQIAQYNETCESVAKQIHELRRYHEALGAFVTNIASMEGTFEDNVRSWLPTA